MLKKIIGAFIALALGAQAHAAPAMETKAAYALLRDFGTGQVLLAKNADERMHPSFMSKLMTLYVLFSRLKEGRVKLTDSFRVSEKAWRTQGSKTFVHVGDTIPVEDLIRGIIIQSGNDACIVVAEAISGTEEAFAQELNRVAAKLGLSNSHFVNATGLPDDNHLMTARDLATLAGRIISDFPEYYPYFAEKAFTFANITQPNRNRLLGNDIGVDGLKTGHTESAGFGITLSAKNPKDGRRAVLVLNGLASDSERMEEGDKLLRWAFREFENRTLVKAGEKVAEANVWFGARPTVALAAEKDLLLTLPVNAADTATFMLRYTGPLAAPVQKGALVAQLVVSVPGMEETVIPLVAAEDVGKMSGLRKIWETGKYLVLHKI